MIYNYFILFLFYVSIIILLIIFKPFLIKVPSDYYELVDENFNKLGYKQYLLERIEQYQCYKFINSDAIVLELGGRYGVVSICINKILSNPKNHIVFEPDNNVIKALEYNRKISNSNFIIIEGIISNKNNCNCKINYNGYGTNITFDNNDDNDNIKCFKLSDINCYNFNTLVIDCEGCFNNFLHENYKFLNNIHTII